MRREGEKSVLGLQTNKCNIQKAPMLGKDKTTEVKVKVEFITLLDLEKTHRQEPEEHVYF
jgi:hypothetical protein